MKQVNPKKLFVTQANLHALHYMYLYMSSLCQVKNCKIILFCQKWCVRLNETLEPAVNTYIMIDNLPSA